MTGRRDQDPRAGFSVPEEYADLAEHVTRHLSSYSFDPATRARHLHQLRELAAAQPLPRSARGRAGLRWRGLPHRVAGTAAASLAAVMLSGSAVAAASRSALPGDALYEAKRLVERVELAAALTPQGKVALRLDHAELRLQETEELLEQGVTDPQLLEPTLTDMGHDLNAAEQIAAGHEELIPQVKETAANASERLEPIAAAELPESAGQSADATLATAQQIASPSGSEAPNGSTGSTTEPGSNTSPEPPRPDGGNYQPEMPPLPPVPEDLPPMPSMPDTGDTRAGDTGTGDMGSGDSGTADTGTGDPATGGMGTGDTGTGDTGMGDIGTDGDGTGSDRAGSRRSYPYPYPSSYPKPPSRTPSYPTLPTSYTSPPSAAEHLPDQTEGG